MYLNRRVLIAAIVLGLVGLAGPFAPTASAQQDCVNPKIQVEGPSDDPTIQPLGGAHTLSATVIYGPPAGGEGGAPGVTPVGPTRISIQESSSPSWASVSITPKTLYGTADQESGPKEAGSFKVSVALQADAPALSPGTVEVDINAEQNGNICEGSLPFSWQITPAYYDVTSFEAPSTFSRSGPDQKISFPITVVNNGNGATYYQFEITQQPEKWEIPLPFPQTINSPYTGGEGSTNKGTATVDISTQLGTQYYNDIGVVNMKTSPAFAQDKSIEGTPITISLVGHFQGVYVPGFEVPAILGALGAVAMFLRRRNGLT